ncbi:MULTISPECIES: MIP/aquaporin family protein [Streptomyces]|nr:MULTISPECIES: MIP/aquaporin family protein [Streptomyces]
MLAEFLGTFVLILLGTAAVAVAVAGLPGSGRQAEPFGPASWLIIAFGWGFAVVFGIYVAGGITGAHINPAVTLAFALRRGFAWWKVLPYWLAQLAGAFVAAMLTYAVYRWAIDAFDKAEGLSRDESLSTYSIFATFPAEYFGGSVWGPLLDQIVGTAVLVLLVCAVADLRNTGPGANLGPYVIGMIVLVIGLTFGPNAGYAINPARDFGPRLWAYFAGWGEIALPGTYEWFSNYWWIPIAGPLAGGVVGVLVYDAFIGQIVAARARGPEPGRLPTEETQSK